MVVVEEWVHALTIPEDIHMIDVVTLVEISSAVVFMDSDRLDEGNDGESVSVKGRYIPPHLRRPEGSLPSSRLNVDRGRSDGFPRCRAGIRRSYTGRGSDSGFLGASNQQHPSAPYRGRFSYDRRTMHDEQQWGSQHQGGYRRQESDIPELVFFCFFFDDSRLHGI
ncbi:unnamed protein product [Toxocara canis]|uniref:Uncharacterized protein n=1 Tax=Toxocara canis TaxID=6265 RepID=A0A183U467_TOXCA|nr:unnamed protein product [Toxocara canis]